MTFDKASSTLSDEDFMLAAVAEPDLLQLLKDEFGPDAKDIVASVRSGGEHPRHWDAFNCLLDAVPNCGRVLSTFTARESNGPYDISVIGYERVCVVRAPEFATVGPFHSVEAAEDYVVRSWADLLESSLPTSSLAPAIRAQRKRATPRVVRPPKHIRIGGRWYARISENHYFAHRSSLFNQDRFLSAEELGHHLARHGSPAYKVIAKKLAAKEWNDVAVALDQGRSARHKAAAAAIEQSEAGFVSKWVAFIEKWLSLHRSQHSTEHEALYWAMRDWINAERETRAGDSGREDEDVSVSRLHQHALELVEMYRRRASGGRRDG